MDKEILFVFGPARGGTTFVNNLLDEWFSLGTGPEGTFIGTAIRAAKKAGDLSDAGNRRKVAEAISGSTTFEIIRSRWSEEARFDVTPDDILERMDEPTVGSAVYAAFKSIADYRGKALVGSKNPGFWRFLPVLHSMFPCGAKYLFVMRDGRDVALSLRFVPWGGQSAYEAAKDWARMVESVRAFERVVPADRILTVKYEQLLQRPGDAIDEVAKFLGVEDRASLRARYEDAAKRNRLSANFDKWRTEMPSREQIVFEAVAGKFLTQYGYERKYPDARLGKFEKLGYEAAALVRKVRVNIYHSFSSLPIGSSKWRPAWLPARVLDTVQPGTSRKKKRG